MAPVGSIYADIIEGEVGNVLSLSEKEEFILLLNKLLSHKNYFRRYTSEGTCALS